MTKEKISLKDKMDGVKDTVHDKAKEVDKFVKKKPYKALGIVAGVSAVIGAAIGFFLKKKKE